jgi:hypothetical protein
MEETGSYLSEGLKLAGMTTDELLSSSGEVSKIISGQGKMETTEFGAKRESNDGRGRFDLFPYEAMESLAKWYEAGAQKYAERNWEQGISVKDCINRMIRHALKAGNGWTDEDHLAAVMWNAAAAITMMKRRPDCNDHTWHDWHDNTCDKNVLDAETVIKKIEEMETEKRSGTYFRLSDDQQRLVNEVFFVLNNYESM